MKYLIYTNVISELVKQKPNKNLLTWFESVPSTSLYLSVLTLGEIRKGVELVKDPQRKIKLLSWLEDELPSWFEERFLDINKEVVDRWGRLLAEVKRQVPAIDSLIAATALHYDLCLITRNERDFNYPSIMLINPWNFQ